MSDQGLEQRWRLRSVRVIRGMDSNANLNEALWDWPNGRSPAPFATSLRGCHEGRTTFEDCAAQTMPTHTSFNDALLSSRERRHVQPAAADPVAPFLQPSLTANACLQFGHRIRQVQDRVLARGDLLNRPALLDRAGAMGSRILLPVVASMMKNARISSVVLASISLAEGSGVGVFAVRAPRLRHVHCHHCRRAFNAVEHPLERATNWPPSTTSVTSWIVSTR